MSVSRRIIAGASVLAVSAVAALFVASSSGAQHRAKLPVSSRPPSIGQVIARSSPSVVRIIGKEGGGSGFVVDAAHQLVLTNDHVVSGNDGLTVQVGNNPSTTTPAQVVASSPCDDLAVVRLVDPVPGLKALPLGSAASVAVGDSVVVLGFPGSLEPTSADNPYGQSSNVTSNTGTVSGVDVPAGGDPSLPKYPQTIEHQAPVNPGNSGGPLLNANGDVVGVNALGNGSAQGQYYSISIDLVKRILPSLEAGQSHANLGWHLVELSYQDQDLPKELRQMLQLNGKSSNELANLFGQQQWTGMYDEYDDPGSPAEKAGVGGGSLITAINGVGVGAMQDVCSIVTGAAPGETLRLSGIDLNPNDSSFLKSWVADVKMPRT